MFHWNENFFFGRCVDGAVRLVKFESPRSPHAMWKYSPDAVARATEWPDAEGDFNDVKVLLDVRIPAEQWASIVASVSAKGESDRHQEALHFHQDE